MVGSYGVSWDARRDSWSISAGSGDELQQITGLDGHALMFLAVMMVQTVASDGTTWPGEFSDDPVETLARQALQYVLEGMARLGVQNDDDDAAHERLAQTAETLDAIHGDLFAAVQRLAGVRDQIMDGD